MSKKWKVTSPRCIAASLRSLGSATRFDLSIQVGRSRSHGIVARFVQTLNTYQGVTTGRKVPLSETGRLQSQLSSAILPEQASLPDVATYHLDRTMPCLVHDGPF